MSTLTNYSNRLVDLELLQTTDGKTYTKVTLSLTNTPKIVTGVQKLIQRYCVIFLSIKDARFSEEIGTDMLLYTMSGALKTQEQVASAFAFAPSNPARWR